MAKKPLFYIYGRKEMGILILLGLTVSLFAFTLGIHLGKKVGHLTAVSPEKLEKSGKKVEGAVSREDQVPDRLELAEQSKKAKTAANAALNQALHEEVARTGIQLDTPRQVRLPEEAKSPNQGETTLTKARESELAQEVEKPKELLAEKKPESDPAPVEEPVVAKSKGAPMETAEMAQPEQPKPMTKEVPSGKFTIQIGSHPNPVLAREHLESLEALGMKPFVMPAQVEGKEWFRVYLGGYGSKQEAKEFGDRYKRQHVIDSFMVSSMPEKK